MAAMKGTRKALITHLDRLCRDNRVVVYDAGTGAGMAVESVCWNGDALQINLPESPLVESQDTEPRPTHCRVRVRPLPNPAPYTDCKAHFTADSVTVEWGRTVVPESGPRAGHRIKTTTSVTMPRAAFLAAFAAFARAGE